MVTEVSNQELREFCFSLQSGEEISLYNFMLSKRGVDAHSLGQIQLPQATEGDYFNLAGADLSGVIFDGHYTADNWQFSAADRTTYLRGAHYTENCKFTGLDFDNVDFGFVRLSREVFAHCQFRNAIFSPTTPDVVHIKVGIEELQAYYTLRLQSPIPTEAKGSFCDYINSLYCDRFNEDIKEIVPDLSDLELDFSYIDLAHLNLSRVKMHNTTIKNATGEGMQFRECDLHKLTLMNCNANKLDLRGSDVNQLYWDADTVLDGAITTNELLRYTDGIREIIPGTEATIDWCYERGKPSIRRISDTETAGVRAPLVKRYIACTRAEVEEFIRFIDSEDSRESFVGFMKRRLQESEEFVPDLSGVLLDGLDLSKLDFSYCLMRNCSFVGAKCVETKFVGSNLTGARANATSSNLWRSVTGREDVCVSFRKADFTDATLDHAAARGAIFDEARFVRTSATNADFSRTSFLQAIAEFANFSNSYFELSFWRKFHATFSNFSNIIAPYISIVNQSALDAANLDYALMPYCVIKYSAITNSSMVGADLDTPAFLGIFRHTAMDHVDLTGTKFWAEIRASKLRAITIKDVEISGIDSVGGVEGSIGEAIDSLEYLQSQYDEAVKKQIIAPLRNLYSFAKPVLGKETADKIFVGVSSMIRRPVLSMIMLSVCPFAMKIFEMGLVAAASSLYPAVSSSLATILHPAIVSSILTPLATGMSLLAGIAFVPLTIAAFGVGAYFTVKHFVEESSPAIKDAEKALEQWEGYRNHNVAARERENANHRHQEHSLQHDERKSFVDRVIKKGDNVVKSFTKAFERSQQYVRKIASSLPRPKKTFVETITEQNDHKRSK